MPYVSDILLSIWWAVPGATGFDFYPDSCDILRLVPQALGMSPGIMRHEVFIIQRFVMCGAAGLGDVAVPGLLACLALRFDATRATNMHARADAAASAMTDALAALEVNSFAYTPLPSRQLLGA